MRIRIDFGYDGSDFRGWAVQPGRRTVEQELTNAWATVLRVDPPKIVIAGRTDAGVHARGAVCHLEVDEAAWAALPGRSRHRSEISVVARLNGVLPADVVVHTVAVAPAGFDARFSAINRRYSYRICDDPAALDPLRRHDTAVLRHQLDLDRMNEASSLLLGLNDFAAFCKKRVGATTVRTLLDYTWSRGADGIVEGRVIADAFCHSMVRALVGVVVPVGTGQHEPEWAAEVLAGRARHPRVTVMPARGLCLEEVAYPPLAELARRAQESRAVRSLPE
ncbi:tRNA pseudouridine(38-40) synthase TruA [Calidifontibacter terrae]